MVPLPYWSGAFHGSVGGFSTFHRVRWLIIGNARSSEVLSHAYCSERWGFAGSGKWGKMNMSRFPEKFEDGGFTFVLLPLVVLLSSCVPSGPSVATEIDRESSSVSTETDAEVSPSRSVPV